MATEHSAESHLTHPNPVEYNSTETESTGTESKPLAGWKVLIPRGGPWGDTVSATLRMRGATPIVAPMINFAPADDQDALSVALAKLEAGDYDWITLTSATTVDVLISFDATIPKSTKVAAVGETTAAALIAAGYHVDLVPSVNNSAQGLLDEWITVTGAASALRVLALRSAIAKPVLSIGLEAAGHQVDAVVAYRTVGIPADQETIKLVHAGEVRAILVTSGSVAQQLALQFGDIPKETLVAAIGPRTRDDAQLVGVRVDVVATQRTADSLIEAVVTAAIARG